MAKLFIFPGTDGTGSLLQEFSTSLGNQSNFTITYPLGNAGGYDELLEYVSHQLPSSEPYFILGESFGGPLAVKIGAAKPKNLAGIVLCASFVKFEGVLPHLLWPLATLMPSRLAPISVLSWFLMGRFSTPQLRSSLGGVVASIPPSTLRARVQAALGVDVSHLLAELDVPLLYLQATDDRIVPSAAGRRIVACSKQFALKEITGPHFLLQTAPAACAREVRQFIDAHVSLKRSAAS